MTAWSEAPSWPRRPARGRPTDRHRRNPSPAVTPCARPRRRHRPRRPSRRLRPGRRPTRQRNRHPNRPRRRRIRPSNRHRPTPEPYGRSHAVVIPGVTRARPRHPPLTPDTFPDLAALFEEGGDPKWCWCTYFRVRGRDWTNSTAEGNRAELDGLAGQDPAPGLLAYRGDRAIGWVSLGPREDFARLANSKILAPIDDTPVWSIVCFVVSRKIRGGRASPRRSSTAAIDYARDRGATMLEAYPVDTAGEKIAPANAFHGTLQDVRAGRLRGRRTSSVEQDEPDPTHRPSEG